MGADGEEKRISSDEDKRSVPALEGQEQKEEEEEEVIIFYCLID
jgi:hypothetical protein